MVLLAALFFVERFLVVVLAFLRFGMVRLVFFFAAGRFFADAFAFFFVAFFRVVVVVFFLRAGIRKLFQMVSCRLKAARNQAYQNGTPFVNAPDRFTQQSWP